MVETAKLDSSMVVADARRTGRKATRSMLTAATMARPMPQATASGNGKPATSEKKMP